MSHIENVKSLVPMNCNKFTARLRQVAQESLFRLIAHMLAHKGRSQQFGGHRKSALLNELVCFKKLVVVSVPGQRG
jgi:hypothetical protein